MGLKESAAATPSRRESAAAASSRIQRRAWAPGQSLHLATRMQRWRDEREKRETEMELHWQVDPQPRGVHIIKTAMQNSWGRENAQVWKVRGLEYTISDSRGGNRTLPTHEGKGLNPFYYPFCSFKPQGAWVSIFCLPNPSKKNAILVLSSIELSQIWLNL
jgi:hypothetical protein